MGDRSKNRLENKSGKYICMGLLAHVDAGKTTLSEGLLYTAGKLRQMGRVDNGDAFLDTHEMEKERGITIFSKQAVLEFGDTHVTLLDTPGHVDFSAEMERTLQVLDYAILVISGADGVQGHTRTLWKLLGKYGIPTFLFVNKMDQPGTDRDRLLQELRTGLSGSCVDFTDRASEEFVENIALCDEELLERFLDEGGLDPADIPRMIGERKVYPCFFGSALKMEGVEKFYQALGEYVVPPRYPKEFGAKVFKIARDEMGARLTHVKVTGGILSPRMELGDKGRGWLEKVNQIRIYSGSKYEVAVEAPAGMVCALTGLARTYPGEGLGGEKGSEKPVLEPVLTYQIQLPPGMDATVMLPKLRQIEEEEPELHIVWKEELQEIQAQVMGEVQVEILQGMIAERFGVEVGFGTGNIVYKETIAGAVEGVGHFEPLRHYAEVHLWLEPGVAGSGFQVGTECSEDVLDRNWQQLVLTHLTEREHCGVLTGSALTDVKVTLIAGRAHQKHTEGGDFRQATYRAVRQGLMRAESVLLEPYYEFCLEVPEESVGRAMTDLERMAGTFSLEASSGGRALPPERMAVLVGSAPVATMRDYPREVAAYTRGRGRLSCSLVGYRPCHNADEVMLAKRYDPERDTENPAGSVFCAHGAGFTVPWNEVQNYMHIDTNRGNAGRAGEGKSDLSTEGEARQSPGEEEWIGTDEVDRILEQATHANRRRESVPRGGDDRKKLRALGAVPESGDGTRGSSGNGDAGETNARKEREGQGGKEGRKRKWDQGKKGERGKEQERYLLVDGYNIIFAWGELKEIARMDIEAARGRLQDILCDYQGFRKCRLILVFDAYRVQNHRTEAVPYHNITVVYTKEAETADQYIEKFAHDHARHHHVTVATSDGMEQIIIRGEGCRLLSASEFEREVRYAKEQMREFMEQ